MKDATESLVSRDKKHEEAESEIEGIFDCMEDGKVKIRSFCGSQYYDFSEEEEEENR